MLWLDVQDCVGSLLLQDNATVLELMLMQEQMHCIGRHAPQAAAASYL
jgi:hypothetical protein